MKHLILIATAMMLVWPATASRVTEIEEFYHMKVSDLLKTRFPEKPFTVFVTVDTGSDNKTRRDFRNSDVPKLKLPYWESEQSEVSFWERTDVPLGTLISQLNSVKLDIQVDASLSETETSELQESIAAQLKLDPSVDTIAITRMDWSNAERFRNFKWVSALFLVFFLLMVTVIGLMARFGMARLIRGLSKPIREISQSTKQFADSAFNSGGPAVASRAAAGSVSSSQGASSNDMPSDLGATLLEIRKGALELLSRNKEMFTSPDTEFIDYIEKKGKADPKTMGSILAELDEAELVQLFRYGSGDWWFVAISQPSSINGKSLSLLGQIDRLRVRRQISAKSTIAIDQKVSFELTSLYRLHEDGVAQLLRGSKIEDVMPIFELLPRDFSIGVAKKVFPGQWAMMLDDKIEKKPLDFALLNSLSKKAIAELPLRDEADIKVFFRDLDVVNFLNLASLRDEEDFYNYLPEDSRIIKGRYPFFRIFEGDKEVFSAIAGAFSVDEWAHTFFNIAEREKVQLLQYFPERMKYQIQELSGALHEDHIDSSYVASLRRSIVATFLEETERREIAVNTEAAMNVDEDLATEEDSEDEEQQVA